MAKSTKKKTKFPLDREATSEFFKTSKVSSYEYTTNPGFQVTLKGKINEDVQIDVLNAIDDVLKFHGL